MFGLSREERFAKETQQFIKDVQEGRRPTQEELEQLMKEASERTPPEAYYCGLCRCHMPISHFPH